MSVPAIVIVVGSAIVSTVLPWEVPSTFVSSPDSVVERLAAVSADRLIEGTVDGGEV